MPDAPSADSWRMRMNFQNTELPERTNLIAPDFAGGDLTGLRGTDASLKRANLCDAILVDAVLHDVRLSSADLTGADLAGADLAGADLTGATLDNTHLCALRSGPRIATGAWLTAATYVRSGWSAADLDEWLGYGARLSDEELERLPPPQRTELVAANTGLSLWFSMPLTDTQLGDLLGALQATFPTQSVRLVEHSTRRQLDCVRLTADSDDTLAAIADILHRRVWEIRTHAHNEALQQIQRAMQAQLSPQRRQTLSWLTSLCTATEHWSTHRRLAHTPLSTPVARSLAALLAVVCDAATLRQFIASGQQGAQIEAALPDDGTLAHDVVDQLEQRGLINGVFFSRLARTFPAYLDEFVIVARRAGLPFSAASNVEAPPPPDGVCMNTELGGMRLSFVTRYRVLPTVTPVYARAALAGGLVGAWLPVLYVVTNIQPGFFSQLRAEFLSIIALVLGALVGGVGSFLIVRTTHHAWLTIRNRRQPLTTPPLHISAHQITIGDGKQAQTVPLSSVLGIEAFPGGAHIQRADGPIVVLQHQPEPVQRWVVDRLNAALHNQALGTPLDVPDDIRRLKQARPLSS